MVTLASWMTDVLRFSLPEPVRKEHVHYRYMLSWAGSLAARRPEARMLDFGCGEGQVVEAGRASGLEIYGTDVFYEGEKDRDKILERGLLGTAVREMRDGRIPFEDGSFDLILSNQVFEHVRDLDAALSEVSRVLKADGVLMALFPTREVLREAHCGVPFLHWLPVGTGARVRWAELWGRFGSGFEKEKKSRREWATEAVAWMDRFVHYRTYRETLKSFRRWFRVSPIEEHYLAYRLSPLLRAPLVREAGRVVCRLLNGVAILARKRPA